MWSLLSCWLRLKTVQAACRGDGLTRGNWVCAVCVSVYFLVFIKFYALIINCIVETIVLIPPSRQKQFRGIGEVVYSDTPVLYKEAARQVEVDFRSDEQKTGAEDEEHQEGDVDDFLNSLL